MNMKKSIYQLPFLLLVSLILVSCGKDKNAEDSYFVKIKKDGTWISFPSVSGELGPDLFNASYTNLGIAAVTTDRKERFDLIIQVNGSNFTTGVYKSLNSYSYVDIQYTYIDNTSSVFNYMIDNALGRPQCAYTVNITEITSTSIRGNFTGNYLSDVMHDGVLEITEGEFYVKRVR